MKVTIEREGETLVAMAEDRVDGTNASEFQQALEAAISESDRIVILDCEQLSYISSAGLRVVLLTARALQRQNSKFAVCSLSEQIREVFEISGFDKIIPRPLHSRRRSWRTGWMTAALGTELAGAKRFAPAVLRTKPSPDCTLSIHAHIAMRFLGGRA